MVYSEGCGLICKDLDIFQDNIPLLISSLILYGQGTFCRFQFFYMLIYDSHYGFVLVNVPHILENYMYFAVEQSALKMSYSCVLLFYATWQAECQVRLICREYICMYVCVRLGQFICILHHQAMSFLSLVLSLPFTSVLSDIDIVIQLF